MKQSIAKILVVPCLLPGVAAAHTGLGGGADFMHGVSHPIGGADHLLAMIAVGIWAAQLGRRAAWLVPCTFVAVMILGGVLGFSGLPLPFIEAGILASVLILGALIAGAFRLPPLHGALLVGFFALFHGHAHGAEMPASIGAGFYTVGFALATALLHAAGMGLGVLMQKSRAQMLARLAGGAVVVSGVYLALA